MIPIDEYAVFDPLKSSISELPKGKGCYLIVLRSGASFIESKKISVKVTLTPICYHGDMLNVVFVGVTEDLRNECRSHFWGSSDNASTFWKSIGCLMGHRLYKNDTADSSNGSLTRFSVIAGNIMRKWIRENLLFLYDADNKNASIEEELIRLYNPPLNIVHNTNVVNAQYRKQLYELRNGPMSSIKKKNPQKRQPKGGKLLNLDEFQSVLQEQKVFCPLCGTGIMIPNMQKDIASIRCPSCNADFPNPLLKLNSKEKDVVKKGYWDSERNKLTSKGRIVVIVIGVILGLCMMDISDSTVKHPQNTPTKAPGNIVVYLKLHYLKDPDSYEGIDWGPSGKYDDTTYYMWHKYRAKNSFGGYVIEEKMFLLDSEGDVVGMAN